MGGYGLFGIILDLEVEMVSNMILKPSFEVVATQDFAQHFVKSIKQDARTRMAYGRVSVARARFLEESLIVAFHEQPDVGKDLPRAGSSSGSAGLGVAGRERAGRRESAHAGSWKLWPLPPLLQGHSPETRCSMNLFRTSRDEPGGRTDILHEYFIPPERLNDFIKACQDIIPRSKQELLNITFRYVETDDISVLAYAPAARIAAVMSFWREMIQYPFSDMMQMTEELIDRVLDFGGSFYLPYRLHARRDRVEKSLRRETSGVHYPEAPLRSGPRVPQPDVGDSLLRLRIECPLEAAIAASKPLSGSTHCQSGNWWRNHVNWRLA